MIERKLRNNFQKSPPGANYLLKSFEKAARKRGNFDKNFSI